MSYSEKTIEISLESLFQSSWFWGKHWTFSTNNSNNNGEGSHGNSYNWLFNVLLLSVMPRAYLRGTRQNPFLFVRDLFELHAFVQLRVNPD